MTREEAIAYFKDMDECTYGDVEPIQMAIKALEQEPCEQEPCDDAVSRKSVITIIQNHWWNCRDIDKLVNELPPVDPLPTRIHAKWEQLDNEPDTFFITHKYGCSNCGKIQLAKSKNIKNYRYCSKCGADMRGVEE